MKKVIAALMITILLTGCAKVEKADEQKRVNMSRFMQVENAGTWKVVVDRQTGVMYTVSLGSYNIGTFTLLVDAEGNPLIYEGGGTV